MSLNFENNGVPIALVKKGKKTTGILCVDDKKQSQSHFNKITLKPDEHFEPIPDPKKERSILYITAQSGAGKSYFVAEWVKRYQKMFPDNNVYLLSSLTSDPTIDKIKNLMRIKLDEFVEDKWNIDDVKDACLILDDTDCVTDKIQKKAIDQLLSSVLQTGRHTNTTCLFTSHLATAGKDTKLILNECQSVTIFPSTMGNRQMKYLLEGYFGLDNKEIKKLKKLEGRWVQICKTYPKCILSEKEAFLPSLMD